MQPLINNINSQMHGNAKLSRKPLYAGLLAIFECDVIIIH